MVERDSVEPRVGCTGTRSAERLDGVSLHHLKIALQNHTFAMVMGDPFDIMRT